MGKQWKQWETLFSWAPKSLQIVTAAMKLKHLLLERKAMTNLDSTLKSRDITLPTKVCLVKAMVFPVVMCGCESWTIKKAEHQRIDAFELWCWRRLLRVPWIERRWNQSILKEISPEYSLEGQRLKLKLQYFGHLMQRTNSLAKILMLGKIEGGRRRGRQRMRWLDAITDWMDMSSVGDGQGSLVCCSPRGCKEWDTTEWLNWTKLNNNRNKVHHKYNVLQSSWNHPLHPSWSGEKLCSMKWAPGEANIGDCYPML